MAIFGIAALGGSGLGPAFAGWIEMNPHLEWRWIQWILAMLVEPSLAICSWISQPLQNYWHLPPRRAPIHEGNARLRPPNASGS